jgi:hypothetical protein
MYLLYLDESGNPDDAADKYFVIGGVAIFERVTFFLSQQMDALQTTHCPGVQPIEFHASPIRAGRGFWRGVDISVRQAILTDIGDLIANANQSGLCMFAAAVEKNSSVYGEDAVKLATEQVCRRFDTFLTRRGNEHSDPQRGLLVFAESREPLPTASQGVGSRISRTRNSVGYPTKSERYTILCQHKREPVATTGGLRITRDVLVVREA